MCFSNGSSGVSICFVSIIGKAFCYFQLDLCFTFQLRHHHYQAASMALHWSKVCVQDLLCPAVPRSHSAPSASFSYRLANVSKEEACLPPDKHTAILRLLLKDQLLFLLPHSTEIFPGDFRAPTDSIWGLVTMVLPWRHYERASGLEGQS